MSSYDGKLFLMPMMPVGIEHHADFNGGTDGMPQREERAAFVSFLLRRFVVMLMQLFELCNLSRIEERYDLLVCALDQRLHLLMFLIFAQAGVLVKRL